MIDIVVGYGIAAIIGVVVGVLMGLYIRNRLMRRIQVLEDCVFEMRTLMTKDMVKEILHGTEDSGKSGHDSGRTGRTQ